MKHLIYIYIIILVFVTACDNFESVKVTEKPYANQTSVELYIGEQAGDLGSIQLKCSPAGAGYVWTSQNTSIATVDQTGLITAVGEGLTSIILSSKNDQTVIDVKVMEYVPLTGFTLSTHSLIGAWQKKTKVFVTPIPDNATNVNIEWTTSDSRIAMVYSNGVIKTLEQGRATIIARAAGHEEQIEIFVPGKPELMSRDGWSIPGNNPASSDGTIGYSSQAVGDGIAQEMIDGNFDTFWHARWSAPSTVYPHWIIIDMGEEVTLAQVAMARRKNNEQGQRGYQIFTCTESGATNLSDPTVWAWEDQGEFSFDYQINGYQKQDLINLPTARYIKIFIGSKYRGHSDYAMIGEFCVYTVD